MILEITSPMWNEIFNGIFQTLYMTLVSAFIAYLIGIPIGILLNITAPNGIKQNKVVYSILGTIVNILRSIPFILLAIFITPLTISIGFCILDKILCNSPNASE